MRKSALLAIFVATIVSTWFFITLNGVLPAMGPEAGAVLGALHAVAFAGIWGLIYLGIADLETRDLRQTAEGLAQQTISKLFRWERTIRALLLMAILQLPFVLLALLLLFADRPLGQAQLFVVPGVWIAAFTGGFILGAEEEEAPYWTIEIAQVVLNLGCFAYLAVAHLFDWTQAPLGGTFKIFLGRVVTFGVLCALGAWIGTRRRSTGSLQEV
ncbi:MAG: hypothetical protein KC466_00015 [Myxococcales bacterium]|nr:hypothetical protein [Myxococcales bacterium]